MTRCGGCRFELFPWEGAESGLCRVCEEREMAAGKIMNEKPVCPRCPSTLFEQDYDGSIWCFACGTEVPRPGQELEAPLPLVSAKRGGVAR